VKEQPDLNWRNTDVQQAMHDTLRFWLDRGIDGFRVDAYWFLYEDPELRDNPPNPDGDPSNPYSMLDPIYTENLPEMIEETVALRAVFDEYDDRVSIGELYLPLDRLVRYYGTPSRPGFHLPFNFHLITGEWNARWLERFIAEYESLLPEFGWPNWVLGNHDKDRVATRIGPAQAAVAAMLLLTLRGTPTLYQGDELGMENVPIPENRIQDPFGKYLPQYGRDLARTPMQWDASPKAGFTTGEPWLPLSPHADIENVEVERENPASMLCLHRDLLALRRSEPALATGSYRGVPAEGDLLVYSRHHDERSLLVALNLGPEEARLDLPDAFATGRVVICTNRSRDGEGVESTMTIRGAEGVVIEPVSA
jgi:alpha-glucosidase